MRSALIALALFLAVSSLFAQTRRRSASSAADQKQQLQEDMQAIDDLHNKEIQANMALDEPSLESLWTDDIVIMQPGAPPIVGRDANVARLKAELKSLRDQQILAYNEQFQEVRIEGDWAYEWGTISGRTTPFSGEGKETDYKFNAMRILQRQPDGSWKIARAIYNDAEPPAPKAEEKKPEPKKQDSNKLED